jgi:hypothetical protein
MVAESAGVHDHENPLIEPPRDDNVRAARDLGDLALSNQSQGPRYPQRTQLVRRALQETTP